MDGRERRLYHQIHPLKLGIDWGTGAVSLYLLWQRRCSSCSPRRWPCPPC